MIDYHIHTNLCKHATGEIHEYIEHAISAGIKELAFTDHIPLPDNFDIAHRMNLDQLDTYCHWIENLRHNYREIIIKLGIEADYYEGFEEYTASILEQYDFDLVIMSIHFVKHWPAGNWIFKYNFPYKDQKEIFEDYLDTMIKGIQTKMFDILGHADIIKPPGLSLLDYNHEKVVQALLELKRHTMAIEINTSGFRKEVAEAYPGLDWLPLIKKFDIAVTVGSDAHSPDQVAYQFPQIYSLLEKENIDELVTFTKREMNVYQLNKFK